MSRGLGDVYKRQIDEEWMQFDQFQMNEGFINDDFKQEVSAYSYGFDGNGNRSTKWEFEFNKVTGAFKYIQIELPSFNVNVLSFVCTPTEPLLP